MIISLVAAASNNNVIGKDNKLLWSLPNDMKHFKNVTWGMPVVMGRKTFESFKQPLAGRKNIVLSTNKSLKIENAIVARSQKDVELLVKEMDVKELMVIGGGEIYKLYLPRANRIYLTRVDTALEGDAFFPVFDQNAWTLTSKQEYQADEKHLFDYTFELWERN
ncbi:dihydrofolate reductase [Niabella drilacis]|uniref:Dihydrofolate reductase n=1 Tax=Niabella drilacis (strain DSM 25811 / CCM 8410 / CCUG 62505 / LMG 26954 / E90) TaxID=1285928 RepID=A0A1G6TZT8_NIADE|nr:dihydrofolate reductase [Niabella drilacis]SDD34581.1 dihydrofolate reductase [Niabella drilacis]